MTAWRQIVRAAALGTDRQTRRVSEPGTLQPVLHSIYPRPSPEAQGRPRRLLDAAAVVHLYRLAGSQPRRSTRPAVAPPPDETRPEVSSASATHLAEIVSDRRGLPVLVEYLQLADAAQLRVPAEQIPPVLEAALKHPSIQPLALSVCGQLGRWLAAQNLRWRPMVHPPRWEEAPPSVRIQTAHRLRAEDPAEGLRRIQGAFAGARAPERRALLDALMTGLSGRDEPFLESCLDDAGESVRHAAAALLAALPESSLSRRMQSRLQGLVEILADTDHRPAVTVRLPSTLDPQTRRDGVVADPPRHRDRRAWWLEQMVGSVPPSVWSNLHAPDRLIEAASRVEHGEALLMGWAAAAARRGDERWAVHLIRAGVRGPFDLWRPLTEASVDDLLREQVEAARTPLAHARLLTRLVQRGAPLGPGPSRSAVVALVATARDPLHSPAVDPAAVRATIRRCGQLLHPSAVDTLQSKLISRPPDATWTSAIDALVDALRFRLDMRNALGEPA